MSKCKRCTFEYPPADSTASVPLSRECKRCHRVQVRAAGSSDWEELRKEPKQSMYGSKEEPRQCPHCQADDRDVYATKNPAPFLRVRYCKCLSCGKNYTTRERRPIKSTTV